MDCYCDGEPASVYVAKKKKARKPHKCNECNRVISVGEIYERVFGVWDGAVYNYKTCQRCLNLRDYAYDNFPCICWSHGNMIDDCIEIIKEYQSELPGMLFRAYRLHVLIKRNVFYQKRRKTTPI